VERFGDRHTDEVLAAMTPDVSRDNDMGLNAFAGVYLVQPAFLEAFGATSDPDRVSLTVRDATGRNEEVTLSAGPARRTPRRLMPPPHSSRAVPLYLQGADRAHWHEPLSDHAAVFAQIGWTTAIRSSRACSGRWRRSSRLHQGPDGQVSRLGEAQAA
jgi:hypothetical protein